MLEVDQRRLTTHSCPPGVKKAATSSASSNNSSGSSSSSSNSSKSSMLNERSCTTGHSKVRSRSHTHVTKSYGEGPRSPLRSLNNGDSSSSSKSGGSSSKQHQGVGNSNNNGSHNNHLHHHHHHQHGGAGGGTRHRPRGAIRASSTERRDASLSVLNLLNKSAALCRLSEELRIGYSSSEGHRHSSSSSAPFPSSSPCAYHGCNNNSSSQCGGRACSAHMPNSYRTYQDIAAWASEVTLGSRDLESRGKLNTSSYPSSFSEPSPDAAISTRTFSSSKKRNTNNKTNRNVNTYEEQSAITPPNEQCLHPTRPCWSSNRSQTASTAAAAADHHYATHSTNNWSPSSPLTSWLDHQSPSSVCVSGLSGLSGVSSSGVSPMSVSPAPCRTSGRPSGNNSAYHHYYLRRQQRSRKFRFNLFMYSALYRKQKRMDNNYLIYHNPMEDPDATYTSFSNPNYFFNQPHRLRSHHSHSSNPDDNNSQENGHHLSNNNNHNHSNNNNNEDDDDVTNEDGLNNKSRTTSISNSFSSSMDGASNRLSLGKLELDPDYYEGHNGAFSDYSSCEPTPTTPDRTLILQKLNSPSDDDDDDELENEIEEDGDDEGGDDDDDDNEEAEQRKGLLSTEKKSKSRSNSNSSGGSSVGGAKAPKGEYVDDEPRVYFGVGSTQSKKSRGILGYLEMLEQQAREREAMLEVGVDERFGERKKEDEEDDGEDDRDGDGEDEEGPKVEQEGEQHVEPPGEENFHGTEINSPDSHDSGIQTGEKTPILSPATPGTNMPPSMEKGDPVVGSGSEEEGEGEVLPEGWQKHENEDGPYYWHVKSGTIQRDPPPP
ncbi:probable serine/threonine-protein kinase DDB_G0276461, partial [Aplysia californica]|uniref:Probable serine/threonine-protein kinase DDB_G0276461 n=1 Tax=Aplysia californica TaxID=6500 RepID=A0ABM0JJW5_APLCA